MGKSRKTFYIIISTKSVIFKFRFWGVWEAAARDPPLGCATALKASNALVKSVFYVTVYTMCNLVLTRSRQIPVIRQRAVSLRPSQLVIHQSFIFHHYTVRGIGSITKWAVSMYSQAYETRVVYIYVAYVSINCFNQHRVHKPCTGIF
jgi:hypothetical protein